MPIDRQLHKPKIAIYPYTANYIGLKILYTPYLRRRRAFRLADELVLFRVPVIGDLAARWVEEENQ